MNDLPPEVHQALEGAMQLAIQRHQVGDLAGAEALYGKVLTLHECHPVALHNLALILLDRGNIPAALELLAAALRENPREATFLFNYGVALQRAGRHSEAEAAYRKAVSLKPGYREAWENLGVVLQERERFEDAITAYGQALHIDGCSPVARTNMGNVLRVIGRLDEAERHYLAALDCNPLNADIVEQYGSTLLSRGDFSGAWRWYEWRYWASSSLTTSPPYCVPLPKWDGTPLDSKRLLLYGEQGVGDEIMFASCVSDIFAQANDTVLLCSSRLVPLFMRSFPGMAVLPKPAGGRGALPELAARCDVRLSLASLPHYFRNSRESFSGKPYLLADAEKVSVWRQRLSERGRRLNVGLSWRGGAAQRAREARSIPLERLALLFRHQDINFINIQYGDHQEEISRFNAGIERQLISYDEIDPLQDMDGFAALLGALDLVITVDNSTVHLAGALGVPTWLLLPAHADWRWLRGCDDTPWYESVRIFWQPAPERETWAEVIQRIDGQLVSVDPLTAVSVDKVAVPTAPTVNTVMAPTALLLNDTAYWYHWGCTCTSLGLHEGLRGAGYVVDSVPINTINALGPLPTTVAGFDDERLFAEFSAKNPELIARMASASIVVINGEGSIHDLTQTSVALLYSAYIAKQRLGKNTQIVNHSCYPSSSNQPSAPADALYRKVYEVLDYVAVREEHSAAVLARLGIDAVQAFDCLPLFVRRYPPVVQATSQRRVVMAGSVQLTGALLDMLVRIAEDLLAQGYALEALVGANAYLAQDDVQFVTALHSRLRGRYRLVAATSEAEWLGTIAGADLLISGRFHHSIAAACLGTPFVVTASNTAKIDGLLRRLGLAVEQVWISPAEPGLAHARVAAILRDPSLGRVKPETLAVLHELAARNFLGLPPQRAGQTRQTD